MSERERRNLGGFLETETLTEPKIVLAELGRMRSSNWLLERMMKLGLTLGKCAPLSPPPLAQEH